MRYQVRKERGAWVVRSDTGRLYRGSRTHAEALDYANSLATYRARLRISQALYRARAALARMEAR